MLVNCKVNEECVYETGPVVFSDAIINKMKQSNVFTIAKRNVEGQDMLYQSLKLVNQIWVLNELKMQPGNPNVTVIILRQDTRNHSRDLKFVRKRIKFVFVKISAVVEVEGRRSGTSHLPGV